MSSSAEFFLEVREKNRNGETWSGCRKDHLWGVAPLREIDKETRAPQAESALFFPWLILLPGSSLSSVRWGRTQLFLVFKGSRSFLWFFAFKWAVVGLLIFFFPLTAKRCFNFPPGQLWMPEVWIKDCWTIHSQNPCTLKWFSKTLWGWWALQKRIITPYYMIPSI